jgi:hypothetical protein
MATPEPPTGVRTHGAGAGGRVAAIALVAVVVAVGLLAVYWSVRR